MKSMTDTYMSVAWRLSCRHRQRGRSGFDWHICVSQINIKTKKKGRILGGVEGKFEGQMFERGVENYRLPLTDSTIFCD